MAFEFPERLKLANLPTPVEPLRGLSAIVGKEVYVKRDDLTGCATSGNKIRKLEYVLAEAKNSGADVVITVGGLQSNHCRATTVACRQIGIEPFLILRGEPGELPEGNLLLDSLCGARFRFITPEQYRENLDSIVCEVKKQIESEGKKGYFIPVGASDEIGALGYLNCAREISEWQDKSGVIIDRIYYPAGSGGTTAGLVLGKSLYDIKADIRGVNVGEPRDEFLNAIEDIIHSSIEKYNIPVKYDSSILEIVEGYYGKGYGDIPDNVVDCIHLTASTDGLIVEPIYTGKALLGLIEEEKKITGGRVLFIHTGGIFSLFAFADSLKLKI